MNTKPDIRLIVGTIVILSLAWSYAYPRDVDGRFTNSPLKPWFDQLKSGKGLCCSFADGYVVEDADWESKDGHYRVRIPTKQDGSEVEWVDVPDDAVIEEPNKSGRTMVWPMYGYLGYTVRCFMPGAEG